MLSLALLSALAPTLLSLPATVVTPATDESGWPREIDAGEAVIVIYQPQLESFEGNQLSARAAVSVTVGDATPMFGAFWLDSRIETDLDERTVTVVDVKIPKVVFADATEENKEKLKRVLERELPKWELTLSLDQLIADLDSEGKAAAAGDALKSNAPKILYRDVPAILVTIDGDPLLEQIEGTTSMRVLNTPILMGFDSKTRRYYLDATKTWFAASDIAGEWKPTSDVPAGLLQMKAEAEKNAPPADAEAESENAEADKDADAAVPEMIVATEPIELIVSEGKARWTPLPGNDILFLANSESDVLLELATQKFFVLLSGRWYRGEALTGPWASVSSNALPESFAAISEESEMGHLLAWVPGTDLAQEAVLENTVPQTAAVERTKTIDVTYDGAPEFAAVEEVEVKYAKNTADSVFLVGGTYFCCREAVWYVAGKAEGPWTVADEVPDVLHDLPASCPHYNCKYVYVYSATPEVVYVGYTPGYMGSYVYGGVVVYGTGYYYQPWYGTYYYARPATWGFHVRWNPWTGWTMGLTFRAGPFRVTVGGWHGGWCGAGRYRHGYRHGYNRGWQHGYKAGARAGYRAGQNSSNRKNMYGQNQNRQRKATTNDRARAGGAAAGGNARPNKSPNKNTGQGPGAGRRNDVYADKKGDVHRRSDDGWQSRENGQWKNEGSSKRADSGNTRDSGKTRDTGRTGDSRSTGRTSNSRSSGGSSLDRSHSSRQRGNTRTQNYNRSTGRSSGGSAHRSSRGGGRRR